MDTATITSPRHWISAAGVATTASVVVLTTATLVLVGWCFDVERFVRIRAAWPVMKPMMALGLAMSALALGFLRREPVAPRHRRIGVGCAVAAAAIGLGMSIEFLAGVDVGFSRSFLPPGVSGPSFHGPSLLVLLGAALLTIDVRPRRGPQPGQFFALVALHVAFFVSLGYVLGQPGFYVLGTNNDAGIALHSVACGGLLALGVLTARPRVGFTVIVLSPGGGGIVMRRLLAMPLVAWLFVFGMVYVLQRAGLNQELSKWLVGMSFFLTFTLAIWWVANVVRRLELDRALLESRFRAVAETAVQAILTADERGTIVYRNPSAERLLGGNADPGKSFAGVLAENSHPTYEAELQRLRGGGLRNVVDVTARRPSGEEFPVEMSLADWQVAGVSYFTAIVNDVSDRKRAEAEVRVAGDQLAIANKELEAFSYSVSHDLRAPLRAIHGFTKILMEDYAADLPQDARDYLREVNDGARQMGQLVDDLLAFARLGRQSLKTQIVESADVVKECLDGLRQEQDGRRLEVTVRNLDRCEGDPALLKQVWTNLIANAFKYTRKKDQARVEIGCERNGEAIDSVTYFVRDNGVGFDMRYAHKLFGVFQRLHRAEEYEGTGVGLAIVHRIVQRHGGRVWADARPGEGATFYFSLKGADREQRRG